MVSSFFINSYPLYMMVVSCKRGRNIGAMLESTLNMQSHVNNISKACYDQIRNLPKIRKCLSEESCQLLTRAFVSSSEKSNKKWGLLHC